MWTRELLAMPRRMWARRCASPTSCTAFFLFRLLVVKERNCLSAACAKGDELLLLGKLALKMLWAQQHGLYVFASCKVLQACPAVLRKQCRCVQNLEDISYMRPGWHFCVQAWRLATSTLVSLGFHTPSFTHTIFVNHHLSHTSLSTTIFHTHFVNHHLSPTTFLTPPFTHTTLSHTIFHTPLCHTPSFTHHLSHTIFLTIFHHTILQTPLCHTPSFTTPSFTHNFVAHHLSLHHLSHTTLSHTIFRHTIFHTPLCHLPSFTHNFVTRPLSHTTFTHTHTIFHTQLCHTHTPSFFVAHHLSHTTLSHTHLCFTSRSSTTSFVFPSFPVPATAFGAHYWKKLPCGVIRPFNFFIDHQRSLFFVLFICMCIRTVGQFEVAQRLQSVATEFIAL